ncbi:WhiB family transcriptional regulator [Rhodococcus sovatensis]|uniref:WhiB family transcriptional regulator n=1 Tax=Rhodococcus sovatensis TaxID=1805840 RepID=A0ABZ2PSL2_9NOCA
MTEPTSPRIPDPSRAACVGQWQLFDPPGEDELRKHVQERWNRAVAVCAGCPVIDQCREYVDELPGRLVYGVFAGTRYGHTTNKAPRPLEASA